MRKLLSLSRPQCTKKVRYEDMTLTLAAPPAPPVAPASPAATSESYMDLTSFTWSQISREILNPEPPVSFVSKTLCIFSNHFVSVMVSLVSFLITLLFVLLIVLLIVLN